MKKYVWIGIAVAVVWGIIGVIKHVKRQSSMTDNHGSVNSEASSAS